MGGAGEGEGQGCAFAAWDWQGLQAFQGGQQAQQQGGAVPSAFGQEEGGQAGHGGGVVPGQQEAGKEGFQPWGRAGGELLLKIGQAGEFAAGKAFQRIIWGSALGNGVQQLAQALCGLGGVVAAGNDRA